HRDAFASGTTCGPLPHPKPAPTGGDRSPTFTPSSTAMVPASPSAPPRAPRPTWTCTSSATTPSWSVTHDKDTPAMTTTPYTPSTDDIVRAYAATRPGDPAEARAELNRWLTTQTVPVTDDLQERLWDAVTDVRDAHPRTPKNPTQRARARRPLRHQEAKDQ